MCAAVRRERKLRSMFNYFLVSLALSDMLSAILVMPLSIMRSLVGEHAPVTVSIYFYHTTRPGRI